MRVAYSPTLALKESYVASYKIYKLVNPINNEIFYIGQTVNSLEVRLLNHLCISESNKIKSDYIQKILSVGNRPLIKEVETIHATCYIDKHFVNERECYWIKYYKSIGCTLLNISISGANSRSEEYHTYLSSIKRNETKWHYYYCGKTYGGLEVYDVKKLEADGFKFTEKEYNYYADSSEIEEYDPWKNPRFVKKIGYIKKDDSWAYIPCYRDLDSKYYDDDY